MYLFEAILAVSAAICITLFIFAPSIAEYIKNSKEERLSDLTPYFGTDSPTVGQILYIYPDLKDCLESIGYPADIPNKIISGEYHGYLVINIKKLKNGV